MMSCITAGDPQETHQLQRLAGAIEQRVGRQRFAVWFHRSTKLRLTNDGPNFGLEISVPNDFISDWIGKHFAREVQEAAGEVLGCSLPIRFTVAPRLFDTPGVEAELAGSRDSRHSRDPRDPRSGAPGTRDPRVLAKRSVRAETAETPMDGSLRGARFGGVGAVGMSPIAPYGNVGLPTGAPVSGQRRLRHDLESFIVGPSNQVAYECAADVAQNPGGRYNPLFIHGHVGLGKTHLLQGLARRFAKNMPTARWVYLTGEEFTNEFLVALRSNKVDTFRRRMRDLDLLVIDDVHFLSGKRATQEEFLHTFNAVEAMGKQVVMASDNHPKMIASFGESLINRFVSGMVVRVDAPNRTMRTDLLRTLAARQNVKISDDTVEWIAARVTQNVRELEGAVTRIAAHVRLAGRAADVRLAQEVLGDLDRHLNQPVRPEQIFDAVCEFFALEKRELMSGRRQRTISLARSVAMYLVRRGTNLSYPDIAGRMGKRNHSTVISACRRVEAAIKKKETLCWTSSVGDRCEEASELVQRLEEQSRAAH